MITREHVSTDRLELEQLLKYVIEELRQLSIREHEQRQEDNNSD